MEKMVDETVRKKKENAYITLPQASPSLFPNFQRLIYYKNKSSKAIMKPVSEKLKCTSPAERCMRAKHSKRTQPPCVYPQVCEPNAVLQRS